MSTTIKPVICKMQEKAGFLGSLVADVKSAVGADADLLLNHPAVYIHVWQNKNSILNGTRRDGMLIVQTS